MKPGWRRAGTVAAVLVSVFAVSAWYKQRLANQQEASQTGPGIPAASRGKTPESKLGGAPAVSEEPRPASKDAPSGRPPRERPERDRTDRTAGHEP